MYDRKTFNEPSKVTKGAQTWYEWMCTVAQYMQYTDIHTLARTKEDLVQLSIMESLLTALMELWRTEHLEAVVVSISPRWAHTMQRVYSSTPTSGLFKVKI
jgi:hypothetical protein